MERPMAMRKSLFELAGSVKMEGPGRPEDTLPEEEREFQKIIALIGGKERIYLVSDISENKEVDGNDAEILQEFIGEMFPGSLPSGGGGQNRSSPSSGHRDASENQVTKTTKTNERPNDLDSKACPKGEAAEKERPTRPAQRTASRRVNVYSPKRTIDSPVIVFIFRQTFLSCDPNLSRVQGILSDVKARTTRATIARPALIGLIRARQETVETRRCAQLLERLLRAVFHKHSPETVWVGCFVPRTEAQMLGIKKNFSRAIHSSQAAGNTRDRVNPLFWPFRCLLWPQRGGARGQTNSTTSRKRGDTGSTEESIPLKTSSVSAGRPAAGETVGGDEQ